MAKKATTFEAAVTRLDEIVKQLEEGGRIVGFFHEIV